MWTYPGTVVSGLEAEDGEVTAIRCKPTAGGEEFTRKLDGLFVAIGLMPDNKDFADIAKLDEWGYFATGEDCRTATQGVFIAGDCRAKRIRQDYYRSSRRLCCRSCCLYISGRRTHFLTYTGGCKMFQYCFFDLDGTITDPKIGITSAVAYALEKYGITVEDKDQLTTFIGPPLHESFCKFFGFSNMAAYDAVDKYREYYKAQGIFGKLPLRWNGGPFRTPASAGRQIIMATSKPEVLPGKLRSIFI